jgi:hypothetical protein
VKNLKIPAIFFRYIYHILAILGVVLLLGVACAYQNYHAHSLLGAAQKLDDQGSLAQAHAKLLTISRWFILPATSHGIDDELNRNKKLADTAQKLDRVAQLLKEHKTAEAQALLKSIQSNGAVSPAQASQITTLTQHAQQSGATTGAAPKAAPSPAAQGGGGGSGGGGTGPGSGGSTPPPAPDPAVPMSQITVTSVSAVSSPYSASECLISQALNFSVNGSGSVTVTWKMLSNKTSSAIYNPVTFAFSSAGSRTDALNNRQYGLEPGDSYRFSAVITSTANSAITATAGPVTVSSCAAPRALMTASGASFMTSITPGALSSSQSADNIFVNECSMILHAPSSVDSSGSVQAVYTITSGSSGAATLYGSSRFDFTGPGGATDTSYIRMPHLNGGDVYSISVTLYDLADHSIKGTASSINSGCS